MGNGCRVLDRNLIPNSRGGQLPQKYQRIIERVDSISKNQIAEKQMRTRHFE